MLKHAVLPSILILSGCQSAGGPAEPSPWGDVSHTSDNAPVEPVSPQANGGDEPSLRDVQAALSRGDLDAAHAALTSVLCRRYLEAARENLARAELDDGLEALDRALELMPRNKEAQTLRREAAGQFFVQLLERADNLIADENPEDALALVDRALELEPDHPDALIRRGLGFFALGTKAQDASFIEDSLVSFREASARSDSPDSWLGASRAAYQLSRTDEALEFARKGRDRLADTPELDQLKIVAEGIFGAFRSQHLAAPESEEAQALFQETEDALNWMIGTAPEDAWAWRELSNLYMWRGESELAREMLGSGIAYAPQDAALHERLSQVAFETGGNDELLHIYSTFTARHPEIALGHWYASTARFEISLAKLLDRPEGEEGVAAARELVNEFQTAEDGFRQARELDATITESCTGYETISRNARGWAHYHAGNLDAARTAFLSMEDLQPGGLQWQLEGSLPTGTKSLEFVASAYYSAQQDTTLTDREKALSMEKGAKIYDYLHAYDPEVISWANDAGFMNRDVAVMLAQAVRGIEFELKSRDLEPKRRDELADEARKMLDKAKELMQKSFQAYVDASSLAPEDVRIVNDTGLIVTYYLQRDLDVAEVYLMRSVALGEEQTKQTDLDEDARYELENALGDAYQNLGVLYLTLKGDEKIAREWFEKSAAIGPDPRPIITQQYLPQCDAVTAGELVAPLVTDETRWDAPVDVP